MIIPVHVSLLNTVNGIISLSYKYLHGKPMNAMTVSDMLVFNQIYGGVLRMPGLYFEVKNGSSQCVNPVGVCWCSVKMNVVILNIQNLLPASESVAVC